MRTQNLQKRVADLESRQIPTDTPHLILGKCSDEELRRLKEIAARTEDGRKELTRDECAFLKAVEGKYGAL